MKDGAAATTPTGGGGANASELAAAERRERAQVFLLGVPGLALVGVILFLPIAWLFGLSFVDMADGSLSTIHYERILHPAYLKSFQTTFELSFLVTGLCILLGFPYAYLMAQAPGIWRHLLLVAVLFPFWTSLLVRTYAWLVLLQRRGVVNSFLIDAGIIDQPLRLMHNFTGTAIGMVHIMLPFMVLPLYAAMRAIDRNLMLAAANVGAAPVRAFWQVYVPQTLPGLLAGTVLVFELCLGFYVTPAVLGGGRVMMWSMQIERSIAVYADWGAASALGVVLLAVTLFLFGVLALVTRLVGGRAAGRL
jgi:putative spermidine/putrescine transport system permease protein/spermidine/putrescine transport system permease protein